MSHPPEHKITNGVLEKLASLLSGGLPGLLAGFGGWRYVCSPDSSPRPHTELISKPPDTSVLGEARKSGTGWGRVVGDSGSVDRVQEHRTPESQWSSLGPDCGADQDAEFATAELLQPEGHLLCPPSASLLCTITRSPLHQISLLSTKHNTPRISFYNSSHAKLLPRLREGFCFSAHL